MRKPRSYTGACDALERKGYIIVGSEISSSTAYAVGKEEIIIIDGYCDRAKNAKVYMLSIKIDNLAAFAKELKDIAAVHSEIIAGRRRYNHMVEQKGRPHK